MVKLTLAASVVGLLATGMVWAAAVAGTGLCLMQVFGSDSNDD